MCILNPNSQFIHSAPHFPFGNHKFNSSLFFLANRIYLYLSTNSIYMYKYTQISLVNPDHDRARRESTCDPYCLQCYLIKELGKKSLQGHCSSWSCFLKAERGGLCIRVLRWPKCIPHWWSMCPVTQSCQTLQPYGLWDMVK